MRFAIDENGQAIGADEAQEGMKYKCAACKESVERGETTRFVHGENGIQVPCDGEQEGLKEAARQQLKTCNRINLPELNILVYWPNMSAKSQRELVQVVEEKTFHPCGIETLVELEGQTVDVLYESGEWRLGVLLRGSGVEILSFEVERLTGHRAGLICIDASMTEFVQGEGHRTWREQLRYSLALGKGNKKWMYHPRSSRIREQAEDRMERHFAFKNYISKNETSPQDTARRSGTPQRYRCSCGTSFMGRAGIRSLCPGCGLPCDTYAVAANT